MFEATLFGVNVSVFWLLCPSFSAPVSSPTDVVARTTEMDVPVHLNGVALPYPVAT